MGGGGARGRGSETEETGERYQEEGEGEDEQQQSHKAVRQSGQEVRRGRRMLSWYVCEDGVWIVVLKYAWRPNILS